MYDVIVIGCGITGAAVAYELSKYDLSAAVLEKNNDVADETTKANSAILHAGYDPEPGSLMAKLNVKGNKLAKELCQALDVPYQQIGSMVLAFSEEEMQTLAQIHERGIKNGVPDLCILNKEQVKKREPQLSDEVKGALYAPTAAVVNPWEYALALAETAVKNGVSLFLNSPVTGIAKGNNSYTVTTPKEEYQARYIINAAGVFADQIHDMVAQHSFTIDPVGGEYYLLDKVEGTRVSHVIFQCPTKEGKGVLVSPTVHGNLIVGPDAQRLEDKEDTATTAEGLEFVRNKALKSVPSIHFRMSIRNFAGLRAAPRGIEDFIVQKGSDRFVDLAGMQSPGLTAAPAVAKLAVSLLEQEGLSLQKKADFVGTRHKVRFETLDADEKKALIAKNPAYGRIVCRCEKVTQGEIVDALHSTIPATSIDGVKRRCNAGMGRCQGGFCGPRVLELICRETGCEPEEVMQDKAGSYVIAGRTKQGGKNHV